ncbi:TPA: dUTP diphosphatase [Candidatus Woesearchaeota archaeon]|nr:Deoxyuridine 5'-triphosphate nucleotidohydrolase [archaeon GW2011_AR15]MBS3103408.1 dUTP diphosphatase [Candidatus Woesearchaeota archaeon]HIH41525.1 dUTP diphosphatase [Candidatus Woesearchaeota archaeon]
MVDVRIVKDDKEMTTPHYVHEGDAGIDLRSSVEYVLKPGETYAVPTAVRMAIPEGYAGLVWDKSGYAAKNSIHTLAGVIDSGYRGEIRIVMKNLGKENFEIKKDMKIAQILIQPVVRANLIEEETLDDTRRGHGGFGSTGKH